MAIDFARLVLTVRNMKAREAEIMHEAEKQVAAIKADREKIEGVLLKALDESNVDSMATPNGTFFRTVDTMPSAQDWGVFYDWIKEHDALDALERRVKRAFIADYMSEHDGEVPPGITVYRSYKLNVRKPTGTKRQHLEGDSND